MLLSVRDRLRYGATLPGLFDYPRGALRKILCSALSREPIFIKTLDWSAEVYSDSFRDTYTSWWERYS